MSCQDWTPEADGYYIIDGKRYKVHIMSIYNDPFASPSNTTNETEITLQGAPYYNVTLFVRSPSVTLTAGTYKVSYFVDDPVRVSLSMIAGNSTTIGMDGNSSGEMTIKISGNSYTLDLNGKLQGKTVQIHYSGLVAKMR
jgi:hypothetical protein